MAYEVTATLRRPQAFDALAGQEFVSKALKSSIESGKIAHAYLFSGPRGCGKTSTARILAKALNCEKGPTSTPCGECSHCKEITAGSSLDVIEVDGASNTSVNDVRQIKDEVMFPPNSSRYKVYIIDEVHMLSTSAFNALLKTIEEPPPHVVFIFATTETQKVPATIKSRCQQFNFRLVSIEEVKRLLQAAAKDEGVKADDEALYWIARQGAGSVRDAYTLFDQVASFSDGYITYDKIKSRLSLVGLDRLNDIFAHCAAGRAKEAIEAVDTALKDGVSIEQLISDAASYMRSVLLIKNGVTRDALLGEARERYSNEVLETWNTVQDERALSLLLSLYRDLRYSLSPRYEVELAISRLSWLKHYVSPREVKAALDALRPLLAGSAPSLSNAPAPQGTSSISSASNYPASSSRSTAQPAQSEPLSSHPPMPKGMPTFSALREVKDSPFVNSGVAIEDGNTAKENAPAESGEGYPPTDRTASSSPASSYTADEGILPSSVRILRDTFHGSVVSVKKP